MYIREPGLGSNEFLIAALLLILTHCDTLGNVCWVESPGAKVSTEGKTVNKI